MNTQSLLNGGTMATTVEPTATGEMLVMSVEGDTKYTWDKNKPDEVAVARETFERFRAKGYQAFEQTRAGSQGRRVTEFDPDTEKLIFIPQLQGG